MSDRFNELGIKFLNKEQYKTICPNCVRVGKIHINDTSLSVFRAHGTHPYYRCHKCGWYGSLQEKTMNFTAPDKTKLAPITDKGIEFLINRGHTKEIIAKYKVVTTSNGMGIVFPYLRDGELVNWKVRSISEKKFFQSPGGLQLLYNYDNALGNTEIIITESEEDCMMVDQAGFSNVVSVSQGAPNPDDKTIEKKLECFNNSYALFENIEKIIICVDNDAPGERLASEIKRRYGAEICLQVKFPENCKDSRDVILKHGKEKLKELIETAKPVKIDGVFSVSDIRESLINEYKNGLPRGSTTYFKGVDERWTWRGGDLNLWTGYTNEGKSTFLSQLALVKAIKDSWTFAFFSPENTTNKFYRELIEMHQGKSMDKSYNDRMTEDEFNESMNIIEEKLLFIKPPENYTLETILSKAKYLVKTTGLKSLILDPYNTIDHIKEYGDRGDQYVGKFMGELKKFAEKYDVCVNLVAHQNTPKKDQKTGDYPLPYRYNIKEGGTFADRADNIIIVWRPFYGSDYNNSDVAIICDKSRDSKLVGKPGRTDITYIWRKNRYYDNGTNPLETEMPVLYVPDKHIEPSTEFDLLKVSTDNNDDLSLPF